MQGLPQGGIQNNDLVKEALCTRDMPTVRGRKAKQVADQLGRAEDVVNSGGHCRGEAVGSELALIYF